MKLDENSIRKQSESAYNQWCVQWREHAKIHSAEKMLPLTDFENTGVGKAILCVANGWSLELEIETIKKYQNNVDIICCDKSLGHLIDNGITPTFCLVCDANVDYEKYMRPWEDRLQGTTLFINACGNPKWSQNGNWKQKYFFVNKDILKSEVEFCGLSGCPNVIPAGTNVSNAIVVFLTQCDNTGRRNFFGYDKILLIGYDYSWNPRGNYYAFSKDGGGKANYMRHVYSRNMAGEYCFTSNNLAFSAMWLEKYISSFKLPVVQCSRQSIFHTGKMGSLADQMQYRYKAEDSNIVRDSVMRLRKLAAETVELETRLRAMASDHHWAMEASL